MYLDCKKTQRKKVKFATQLFSHTVSVCLKRYGDNKSIKAENYSNVAELCELIDKWFDIFNSDSKFAGNNSIAGGYGSDLANQNQVLDEMRDFMSNARMLLALNPEDPIANRTPKKEFNGRTNCCDS